MHALDIFSLIIYQDTNTHWHIRIHMWERLYLCANCRHFMACKTTRTDIDLVRIWERRAGTVHQECVYVCICLHHHICAEGSSE
jgi:hypothetical protein